MDKQQKPKKPIYKRWWFWLLIALLLIGGVGGKSDKTSTPKPTASATAVPTPETTAEPDPFSPLKVSTGEILDVKRTGDIMVVKARVNSLMNNKQTVNQNYFNACSIIRSLGDEKISELQYWAVSPSRSGDDVKIISFTVPGDAVEMISKTTATTFADNTLPDYITDLWILPALKE